MNPVEPLQFMATGMIGVLDPQHTSLPQLIIAVVLITAFVVSLWIPIQDEAMKSLLVGAIGIVLGAYFNDQGHKVTPNG